MFRKYPSLDAKPRMMLKTISLKVLTSTSEDYCHDLSYLNNLCIQIFQLAIQVEIEEAEESESDVVKIVSDLILELIEQQMHILK